MTARILRIELRRSTAPWAAVLLIALGVVMLYLTTDRQAMWMRLVITQRQMLGVLWPLALGAGAWQAGREHRSRLLELISTTPRARWRRVLPTAVAMAIAVAAGYLGMFAAGAGYVIPRSTYFPAGAAPIVAAGAVCMVAAVCLGLAVGRRLPSTLVPPVLAVVSTAALIFAFSRITLGVDPAGAFLFLPVLQLTNGFVEEFTTVTAQAQWSQLAWVLALAGTGLAAFAATSRRGRMLALVPALVGVAVALPLQPRLLRDAFTYDLGAVASVCTVDSPRVCVTRVHEAALADLREPARQALTIMAAKLPDAPTSVVEDFRNPVIEQHAPPQDPGTVRILLDVTRAGRASEAAPRILWQLLVGAGTPDCFDQLTGQDSDRYVTARQAVAGWLLDESPDSQLTPGPRSRSAVQAWTALRSLPPDVQRARVAAFRAAELACDNRDRLDLLVGPAR